MDRVLGAVLRSKFAFFLRKVVATVSPGGAYLHNWHIDAIVCQLMRVDSGQSRRLLINQPPRSLKSITVSVAYVAWLLGHDPTRRVIVCSYSGDFAAELHRQFRIVVTSQWYADLFPDVKWAKETAFEFITTRGGGRLATSIGGTLTGRGADLIIVDDPLNANEVYSEQARKRVIDWYGGALVSRLNDKETGAIIAIMQRLHEDDLAGYLLRQGGWDHLNLPAIAYEELDIPLGEGRTHRRRTGDVLHPERESRATLESIRVEIGSLLFSAQYQQQPVPLEGNLIRWSWFRTYDDPPAPRYPTRTVQSWDAAMTVGTSNDYSVCTTWRVSGEDAHLLDVFRDRFEYPELRRKVIALANEHSAETILIEDAGPGLNLLQDLRASPPEGLNHPIGVKPIGSKVDRMAAQSAKIEAGHLYLPRTASWLAEFLNEMLSFPNGRHDDQVDSVSQFLHWLQTYAHLTQMNFPMPIFLSRPRYFPT